MDAIKLAWKKGTALPILALVFATGVCMALVVIRIARTGNVQYTFLLWNLFLAWLPLLFAMLAWHSYRSGASKGWGLAGFGASWLLFFPNSPYIFTDVIHLMTSFYGHFWVDLVLILSCAFTGLIVGFVSLYLMHAMVSRILGQPAGWLFIAAAAGLSGFGVYVGRFLRFNSWDLVLRPFDVAKGMGKWAADPSFGFPLLFATFFFIAYLMLFALTHLQQTQREWATPTTAAA